MSLSSFHILFITLSVVLSFGTGFFGVNLYMKTSDWTYIALASFSLVSGIGLVWYFQWFLTKMKRLEKDGSRA